MLESRQSRKLQVSLDSPGTRAVTESKLENSTGETRTRRKTHVPHTRALLTSLGEMRSAHLSRKVALRLARSMGRDRLGAAETSRRVETDLAGDARSSELPGGWSPNREDSTTPELHRWGPNWGAESFRCEICETWGSEGVHSERQISQIPERFRDELFGVF